MQKEELFKLLHTKVEELKLARTLNQNDNAFTNTKKQVKLYQIKHIESANQDFMKDSNAKGALNFFLEEIYGIKDLSKRDEEVERFISTMEKLISKDTLEVIFNAVNLNLITETLDNQMAQKLFVGFTDEQYNEAYSKTPKSLREEQISIVEKLGNSLSSLVKIPFLGMLMKTMTIPAKAQNVYNLHLFLQKGFDVFKSTKNSNSIIHTVANRERDYINSMYVKTNNGLKM
jgi:hypothetical protein